jgi:hypothetical protein
VVSGQHATVSWIGGVEEPEIRRRPARWPFRFTWPPDAYPVVSEKDMLTGIDSRHVAVDAIAARLDGTGGAGSGPVYGGPSARVRRLRRRAGLARVVTREADRQIRRAVRRGLRVGIVASHTTERTAALAKATRLEDADRLETGHVGIIWPDLVRIEPRRMPMAGAA